MENQNVFFFYPEAKNNNEARKVYAGIYIPENNTLRVGKAECSVKDKFCKAKGRAIALGRAKCTRPIAEKQFVQKGKVIKTNKDILPISVKINTELPVINQFIQLVKTL